MSWRAAGLIAAAGSSARMGTCKALLPYAGATTFVERIAQVFLAAGLDPVIVTVPPDDDGLRVEQALAHLPVVCATNELPEDGLSGSVVTALRHAAEPDALVLTPVDCPFLDVELVRSLLLLLRTAPASAPEIDGARGHPVAFSRATFELLLTCANRGGPRAVLDALGADVAMVPWSDRNALEDVDTPEDYQRLFGLSVPPPAPPSATRRRG
ncbi:MAG: nucleotidyltransferase family protein [Deltaproteobacteria bacterium]|nr:nucleotidyltransferase family protein [Deltaproteobacteria bacterium]